MIELSKEKQKEVKDFLEYLERELKIKPDTNGNTGLEALTGKSQIKNYLGDYQKGEEHLSSEKFLEILDKNKSRIEANLRRELRSEVTKEYDKSLAKLLPIKEKLRKADYLIDQMVYKLYGLTDEEIEVVEGKM